MKIYKLNIKLFAIALVIGFTSCEDDDLAGLDALNKPTATTTVTSLSLMEGESGSIPFTIDRAITKPSQFKIELIDGNIDEEDLMIGDQLTDADTGIPGKGFEITIPAYATSFEIPVDVVRDLDQTEGTETITLKISAAGVRTILTPEPYLISLTITDFEYCMWTLDVFDAYGDSWQGGQIILDDNGDISTYPSEDWDNAFDSYDVPVSVNGQFSFTYVSGTTGDQPNQAGAPGWEEENSFSLTAPDGTVYSDGPVPTVGIIVSGTNTCN